jgi:hypothetical protein
MRLVWAILGAVLLATPAWPHDPTGKWAQLSAEGKAPPKQWWDSLTSAEGFPCCDTADGLKVEDVDWDTNCKSEKCHFRVRLDGKWRDVPDSAWVKGANEDGPAVVWPVYSTDQNGHKELAFIRCFLPGAGS